MVVLFYFLLYSTMYITQCLYVYNKTPTNNVTFLVVFKIKYSINFTLPSSCIQSPCKVVLDIYHPRICLFLDECQVFLGSQYTSS